VARSQAGSDDLPLAAANLWWPCTFTKEDLARVEVLAHVPENGK